MMRRNERGILTVEASIVLTLFTLFVLFLLSFARVYMAENMVSHATLQAADAVAIESYLRETSFEEDAAAVLELSSYITESDSITAESFESLRTADLPKIAKQKFIAALSASKTVSDEALKALGVKDGIDGIDFSESKMDLGHDDVIVAVTYTIKMQFPILGAKELAVTKTAKAKTFGQILFAVTTESDHPAWGTTSGDSKVVHGDHVQITATPKYGYKFVGWNDGNTDNPRIVTVTDAVKYTARFEKEKFGVNLTVNHAGYGTVSGAGNYDYLDAATISAIPGTHYDFVGWDENNDGAADNTEATRTITVDKTYDFKAIFKPKKYTVSVTVNNGSYGSATVSQDASTGSSIVADYGSTVVLTAVPKDQLKYRFVNWSNSNTGQSISVTVSGDAQYTATFDLNAYTVCFYKTPGDYWDETRVIRGYTINGTVYLGISARMPDAPAINGRSFSGWTYNGAAFTADTAVHSDMNVCAAWSCTVTLDAGRGTVQGQKSRTVTVPCDTNYALTAPKCNGWRFNGWYCGGTRYEPNGTVRVTSNMTLTADWSCKHRYDNGASMYAPISSSGGGCSNSKTVYRCSGCGNEYTKQGVGKCDYSGWCGKEHTMKNPGEYYCIAGTHTWTKYGCMTCIHCGGCKHGGYDSYHVYRSGGDGTPGCLWCIKHNGQSGRKKIKPPQHK